jgi:hypothetical protein
MLVQQLLILGNVTVIEVGDAKIEENIEEKREIKDDQVKPIVSYSNNILNISVNAENKNRLDQKIQKKKQSKVCKKFFLHKKSKKLPGAETFQGDFKKNYDICYKVINLINQTVIFHTHSGEILSCDPCLITA